MLPPSTARTGPGCVMLPFSLVTLILAACAPTSDDGGEADRRSSPVPVSYAYEGSYEAAGSGAWWIEGQYHNGDGSCYNYVSTDDEDCEVAFALGSEGDALVVEITDLSTLGSSGPEGQIGKALDLGSALVLDAAAPTTETLVRGSAQVDVSVSVDADGLHFSLRGEYDTLAGCDPSGTRRVVTCDADYADATLLDRVSPPVAVDALIAGDLAITEVLADPTACDDGHAEWIELRNDAGDRVDLAGLVLVDASGRSATVAEAVVLEPGALAIIGRGALADFCDPSVGPDAGATGSISLNNTGDSVTLYGGATALDTMSYDAVGAGVAWSRDESGAWCEGAPSPGEANAACPTAVVLTVDELVAGELILSEVMLNPAAVADDGGEWIEVANHSGYPVDLLGLELWDTADTMGEVTVDLVVPADGYAWLGRGSAGSWKLATHPDAFYGSRPALNNDGDALRLEVGGVVLDQTPTLDAPSGRAMQRDLDGTWCAAGSAFGTDFGTPGLDNDTCE